MKLGSYIAAAVDELNKRDLFAGKTNIQKMIYFALPVDLRKAFYRPYHYGPYSAEVQQAVSALLKKEVLTQTVKGFSLAENRTLNLEADPVADRIRATADFFLSKGLRGTDDIAMLAKVHLLSRSEREEVKQGPVSYIQSQARFLGWKELSRESSVKIDHYLHMADELDGVLEA